MALGLGLLLLSFARIAGDMRSRAFGGDVLDSVLAQPIWHTTLGRNIALFIVALLALHAAFAILCWALALLSQYAFPNTRATRRQWVLLWFFVGAVWVLIANAALFPHTSLGEPYGTLVRAKWMGVDTFQFSTFLLAAALGSVIVVAIARGLRPYRSPMGAAIAGTILLLAATAAVIVMPTSNAVGPVLRQPNVIVIGLDALRYDVTGMDGHAALAPNVGRFMAKSVTFSDAITPLARTFPSWVSILTGRNPHTTGAVINLLPRDLIHTGDTLGDLFRRAGYRTVYGIDETQFSNVDASYGFDDAISPPIGATDFMISFFGDTPLSNLVVNSRLGAVLFPHLYANRGAAATYDPDEFVRQLDRRLRFNRPTFLAVHLTLSHWPYSWATSPGDGDRFGTGEANYPMGVQRADQQFEDIMSMLKRRGALANALVIVLSDHGEGLGKPDDFPVNGDSVLGTNPDDYQKRGHGTSVLSPHQYHTVLAMRAFGDCAARLPAARVIATPVSMVDLAPTIADLLTLDVRQGFDGRSLVPLLRSDPGADQSFRDTVRFTETEFNPRGVEVGGVSASGLAAAALFYRINPDTDRIEFRREHVPEILRIRQYAALLPDRMLAALPDSSGRGYDLLFARNTGADEQSLTRLPLSEAEDPETARLRAALEKRYGIVLPAASRVAVN